MLQLQDLAKLVAVHGQTPPPPVTDFALGGSEFEWAAGPAVMGVVNLSPDSWYRESVCLSTTAAIERGYVLFAQGAAIIDIGAESTLAHAERVDGANQNRRLIPVVEELAAGGVPVSVETYNAEVARACLEAGASLLNLTGTEQGDEIFHLAADHDAGVILCFVPAANVREAKELDLHDDPVPMLRDYFNRQIDQAVAAGVTRLFIDPGLGFYYSNLQDGPTRVRHQTRTFLNSFRLHELGWPVCNALPHAFEFFREEVRTAEPFFATLAALGGTHLLRTHEVAKVKAVLDTMAVC
jgi:dihydropteroate synthase